MKTLSNSEVAIMESLVNVDQKTLQGVLYKFLKQYYENVTNDEEFLLAEGDIPIALVAHMDTVFPRPAEELYYDRKKNVMWSPTGMGADDRAGVFAILQIISAGYRPHVIFTTDEEKGGIGAEVLSYMPMPFKDLHYMIQLDRRGSNDCVFYECDNPDFEKYIEGFGFVTAYGSFSDISTLCPEWGIAGVNLSIGYRDEHSVSEVLFVGQMLDTIEKVKKMLSEENIPQFVYIPAFNPYYDWDYNYGYGYYTPKPKFITPQGGVVTNVKYRCHYCKSKNDEKDVLPIKLVKGGIAYICSNCLTTKPDVEWCQRCGELFEVDPKHPQSAFCKSCRKGK